MSGKIAADPGTLGGAKAADPGGGGLPGIALSLLGIVAAGAILKAGASFLIPLTVAFFLMLVFHPVSSRIARSFDRMLCRMKRKAGRDHTSRVSRLSDTFSVILVVFLFLFLAGVLYIMVDSQITMLGSRGNEIEENIGRAVEAVMLFFHIIEPSVEVDSLAAYLPDTLAIAPPDTMLAATGDSLAPPGAAGDSSSVRLYVAQLMPSVLKLLPGAAVPIISQIFTFILILFLTAFLLIGRRTLEERLRRVGHLQRFEPVIERIEKNTRSFIRAKVICSVLTGLGVYAVLDLAYLGFQDAVIWGMVYFILNFIPFYGSLVAGAGTTLYTMSVHDPGNFLAAWPVVLLLAAVNIAVSNGIEPKIMQRRLPLGPVTVLFVVILWAWLWGAWGMILAVPMSIVFRLLLEEIRGEDYWLCILMEA